MSRQVDDRVVQMSFDNKQFESAAKESLGTLEKLNNTIAAFAGAKSAGDISVLGKSLSSIGDTVSGVADKFTLWGQIAYQTVERIASKVVDLGEKMATKLTIDQISAGWDKYANKTAAVQTIMSATADQFANTEEQMAYVNAQLDKLNWFTDETSYNFVDMTSNIGKFTSQGIDLEKSVTAMQGIATWAAKSGANAQSASRAMYNLSQALGMGSVRVQDWMSIENANMATKEFKEMVIQTAKELGRLDESGAILKNTSGQKAPVSQVDAATFRNSLSAGWFDTEVLTETLEKYGKFTDKLYELSDISGKTATEILQDINSAGESQSKMASLAKEYGLSVEEMTKWVELLNSDEYALGKSAFIAAQEAKTFGEAIDATADAVSTGWMRIFERIFGDYEQARHVWTDFANFLYDVFASPVAWIEEVFDRVPFLAERILSIFYDIGPAIGQLLGPIKEAGKLLGILYMDNGYTYQQSAVEKLGGAFSRLVSNIKRALEGFKLFEESEDGVRTFTKDGENLVSTFRGLFAVVDIVGQAFKGVKSIVKSFMPDLKDLISAILERTAKVGEYLADLSAYLHETKKFKELAESISNILHTIYDWLKENVIAFSEIISKLPIVDKLKSALDFRAPKEDKFEGFLGILTGIVDSLTQISLVKWQDGLVVPEFISNGWQSLKTFVSELWTSLREATADMSGGEIFSAILGGGTLVGGAAVTGSITKAFSNFGGLAKSFGEAFESLGDTISNIFKKDGKLAENLKAMGTAILLLAVALGILSSIPGEKIATSIGALTLVLSEFTGAAALLGNVVGAKQAKGLNKTASAMIKMAAAVLVASLAIGKLGGMDLETLEKGFGALAVALAEFGGTLALLQNVKNVGKTSAAIIGLSVAMLLLVPVVAAFSLIPTEKLVQGLAGLGVVMIEMAAGLAMVARVSGAGGAAVALIGLALALDLLVPALILLGILPAEVLEQGLIAIAGAILLLAGAAIMLAPAIPLMTSLAGALALFGVSVLAIGVGVLALGAGFVSLAAGALSLSAAVPAAVAAITAIGGAIIALVPALLAAIGEGIIMLISVLGDGAIQIGVAVGQILEVVITVLIDYIPRLVEAVMILIETLLESIDRHLPRFIELGSQILINLATGIAKNTFKLITSLSDVIRDGVKSVLDTLGDWRELGHNLMAGFLQGLNDFLGNIVNWLADLGRNCVSIVKRILGINSPSTEFAWIGKMVDIGLAEGLSKNSDEVNDSAAALGDGIISEMDGLADKVSNVIDSDPTITPVLDLSEVENGTRDLDSMLSTDRSFRIARGIASPQKPTAETSQESAAMSGLVSKLEAAIAGIQNGEQNNSFDFYLDGAKLEAVVTKRQRQRAIATGR